VGLAFVLLDADASDNNGVCHVCLLSLPRGTYMMGVNN
jgi:hypothetical protein